MGSYLADCHVHSRISPDAFVPMADMARAAIAAGMDEICSTDHADLAGTWLGWRKTRSLLRWEDLEEEAERCRRAVGDRIEIRIGIELGDTFCDPAGAERLMASAPPLDFVIGSVHVLSERMGHADLSRMVPRDEAHAYAAMEDYLSLLLDMTRQGGFSVLGHLTLPLRYFNGRRGLSLTFDPYADQIREILRTAVEKGIGIELNTDRGRGAIPGAEWLRLYRDLGGEIVTLGTDSHTAETVGKGIREGQELLRACGFRRFCTFRGMDPVYHDL